MGNNIFRNFSRGNNIPKIFFLFVYVFSEQKYVCMFAIYFYFIVLGSGIPKSINYLGVHVCDCI